MCDFHNKFLICEFYVATKAPPGQGSILHETGDQHKLNLKNPS